jgi:hypothetical protein
MESEKKYKLGIIFFHKNIRNIYKERWILKCIESILNQSYSDFKLYEVNYGEENTSLIKEFFPYFFISFLILLDDVKYVIQRSSLGTIPNV